MESKNKEAPLADQCTEEMNADSPICIRLEVKRLEDIESIERGKTSHLEHIQNERFTGRDYIKHEFLQENIEENKLISVEIIKEEVEGQKDNGNDSFVNIEYINQEVREEVDIEREDIEREELTVGESLNKEIYEEADLVEDNVLASEEDFEQEELKATSKNIGSKESKVTRNAGPSLAQLEKLVGLVETRPNLATGHARTANARTRTRNGWEHIARVLNSDGSGCVKNWKAWAKYWKDKKASVKRKAKIAETARQRTAGGVDADMLELSELERKILTIAGGLSFAHGDGHLPINPFQEQEITAPLSAGSELVSSVQSQSILLQEIPGSSSHTDVMVVEDESPQWNETEAALVGEESVCEEIESSPPPTVPPPNPRDETVSEGFHLSVQDDNATGAVSEGEGIPDDGTAFHNSPVRPNDRGGARRRILVAARSRRPLPPSRRQTAGVSPQLHRGRGGVSASRRLLRRPPSRRRSQMASITERFIAIEERRIHTEQAIARSLHKFAEGHRIMAEAIDRFTATIGNIARQFFEYRQ